MPPASPAIPTRSRGAGPLIVAHRGAWGTAPQNSLAAFENAISMGCDAIEIDVRRTGDDRLVVVHDPIVGGRLVARTEHDAIRARTRPGQAPLLEDVLDLAKDRIALDIELKEDGYVDRAMATIAARLTPDQYVMTSFHDSVLPAVKEHVPAARTGLLVGWRRPVGDLDRRARLARPDFIAPHASLARRGVLSWAQERGLPAWVWTVNQPRALRNLREDPVVEAIITDVPARAMSASASSAASAPV